MQVFKLSPIGGESVNRQVDERGKCEQKGKNENSVRKFQNTEMTHKKSRPRLSGKVAAKPSEGVSWSRNEEDLQNCIYLRSIKLKCCGRKHEKIFLF